MGVVGELLIAAGVLLLRLVAYQLWWTNVKAAQANVTVDAGARGALSTRLSTG